MEKGSYSAVPRWKVDNCLACAALALANRLITVRFVGVMEVLGPPVNNGLFLPPITDVATAVVVLFAVANTTGGGGNDAACCCWMPDRPLVGDK